MHTHPHKHTGQYLFLLEFETVEDYLIELRYLARELNRLIENFHHKKKVHLCFYLSAAVSDYYLSNNERPEHKIQTKSKIIHQNNDGDNNNNNNNNDKSVQAVENLNLTLKPVPKLMKLINTLWAPNSYVISFKVSTVIIIIMLLIFPYLFIDFYTR
ncbi:unnamed protein product [Trichobilharzia regenti]|nr:unnamed protein product [Trichobilharzia regenti]